MARKPVTSTTRTPSARENRDELRLRTPPYEWHPALCQNGPETPGCQPKIQERHVYLDEDAARRGDYSTYDHMQARPACYGCDWIGNVSEDDESPVVESAMDHAFPGWRELPLVTACRTDASPKQKAAALDYLKTAYPAGWIERHGPVRVDRGRIGTRHVAGYAVTGGYEMAVQYPHDAECPCRRCARQRGEPTGRMAQRAVVSTATVTALCDGCKTAGAAVGGSYCDQCAAEVKAVADGHQDSVSWAVTDRPANVGHPPAEAGQLGIDWNEAPGGLQAAAFPDFAPIDPKTGRTLPVQTALF